MLYQKRAQKINTLHISGEELLSIHGQGTCEVIAARRGAMV